MKKNLLKNTILLTAISAFLSGCDTDEGLDYNFSSSAKIEYTDASINVAHNENSGVVEIDLLAGATVSGKALDPTADTIFVREFTFEPVGMVFITPQIRIAEGEGKPDQTISPFTLSADGTKLLVDTNALDDLYENGTWESSLHACDPTDNRGGPLDPTTKAPTPDGYPDNPSSITYQISYIVDNGYVPPLVGQDAQPYEKRFLNLTLNAANDPVDALQAANITVAKSSTTNALVSTVPTFACNKMLEYAIADENIATVDTDGVITGLNEGSTTITYTSQENSDIQTTATITVVPGFNLSITNQSYDSLGAPTGTKEIPSCVHAGINVQPSIGNDELQGEYTYNWMSASTDVTYVDDLADGFGAKGKFSTGSTNDKVGIAADLTVSYGSGYTGTTAESDILPQTLSVSIVENKMCNPGTAPGGAWFTDLKLDKTWHAWNSLTASTITQSPGLVGTAVQLTTTQAGKADIHQQNWNNASSWPSQNYGLGTQMGDRFKFAVWVKLGQLAQSGTELKLTHRLLAWNCTGCDGLANFPARIEAGLTGVVSATLQNTTEWQHVEFINQATGDHIWAVPDFWDKSSAVFQFFEIEGLASGESISFDEYSVVKMN